MLGKPIEYQVREKRNIEMLTWIRGFAALMVVVSHVTQGTFPSYGGGDAFDFRGDMPYLLKVFAMGNFGVTLFFALSGCTLYLGYNRLNSGLVVRAFYVRRFARIYPAFFVSLLAYMLFRPVFQSFYTVVHGYWIEHQFLASYSPFQFFQYLTLSFNFSMDHPIFNNAYWSLPVEFQFYLLFPLLLLLHRYFQIVGILVSCAALYILSLLFKLQDFHTFDMLWQFGGGMLCGHLFLRRPLRIHWTWGLIAVLLLQLLAVYVQYHDVPEFSGLYKGNYMGVIAILMVYICVNMDLEKGTSPLSRFFSWQGDVSYSIYLYHNLFVGAWVLLALHWQIVGWARVAFVGIGVVSCTYLVSHLSYLWVEMPGMEFGKRIARRMESRGKQYTLLKRATGGESS